MKENLDRLKLENQLCFPLYACSKEIVKKYKPVLAKLDLTYTQYIVMLVLWEKREMNLKALGNVLFLDSGTLTPVLKKLEKKDYIKRKRFQEDERNLMISMTKKGMDLKKQAQSIPEEIGNCMNLTPEEATSLYQILYKILGTLKEK